jgi:leader peptidase (prepilin peptidase)/N-methyltransferase
VPLFSFLFLGRKCRTCKQPISWRYFSVELLTGLLFLGLALCYYQSPADAVGLMLFAALLVPITFIDLDFFQIPHSLNLLAFAVALGRDIWGIALHEPAHALLWGWLPRSIPGALMGILIFGGVRLIGWIWKKREAMGLGDVLLARAMGAMLVQLVPAGLPLLRLFPAWVLFSCLSGMVVGIPLIMIRSRQGNAASDTEQSAGDSEAGDEAEEDPGTLKEQMLDIGYCLAFGDLVDYFRTAFGKQEEPTIEEDQYEVAPTAIPFGPFLAIGFLATALIGEALTAWYLAVAIPKPG